MGYADAEIHADFKVWITAATTRICLRLFLVNYPAIRDSRVSGTLRISHSTFLRLDHR